MQLQAGNRVGPYEIVSLLGVGGMGEVYRANDTKLGRQVALKVLPDALAMDSERMTRFTREAHVLASLNHPNIAAIYGVEGSAIVMELVEGKDLQVPLPLDEALPIARQMAEALEAAHDKGIVHRDLKPANIKIRRDGVVKVLDFGLATAPVATSGADSANSPTLTIASQAGVIMGTAGYMSPEQASGRPVDRRSDIWSFGVVLWEMLCGRRLFQGETLMDTLAEVVRGDVDSTALPASTPPAIRELLRRCLDRNVKTRLRDIGEARVVIQEYLANPSPNIIAPAPSGRLTYRTFAAFAAALAILAAGIVYWQRRAPAPEPPPVRFLLTPPEGYAYNPLYLAVSPDGRHVAAQMIPNNVYNKRSIGIRDLDTTTTRILAGTEGATNLFWSPDSRTIGFLADDKLKRMDAGGGPAQVICDVGRTMYGATWNAGGVILFAIQNQPLQRVAASGGTPAALLKLEASEAGHRYPRFLPDGQRFLYSVSAPNARRGIYLASMDGKEPARQILVAEGEVAFAPSANPEVAYLFFRRGDALLASSLDTTKGSLTGEPFIVLENAPASGSGRSPVAASSLAGVIALGEPLGGPASAVDVITFDRTGRKTSTVIPAEGPAWGHLEISPDGKFLMGNRAQNNGSAVWTFDLARGVAARLTSGKGYQAPAAWSHDQKRVFFAGSDGNADGLYSISSDASSPPELLRSGPLHHLHASPDGKYVAFEAGIGGGQSTQISLLSLERGGKTEAAVTATSRADHPQFSPDGRWLSYSTADTGQSEVFVQSVPAGKGRWQVSSKGGLVSRWRADGRELFYLRQGMQGGTLLGIYSVSVRPAGDGLEFGVPVKLFEQPSTSNGTGYFTVSPDGQKFYTNHSDQPVATPSQGGQVTIILNWAAGLKK